MAFDNLRVALELFIPYQKELDALLQRERLFVDGSLGAHLKKEGVYAFWWNRNKSHFDPPKATSVLLKGRKVKQKDSHSEMPQMDGHYLHEVHWDWGKDEEWVCLYVGKSTDILQRVKWHLLDRVASEAWYDAMERKDKPYKQPTEGFVYKRNSMCQFRAGMEHKGYGLQAIKDNIYISTASPEEPNAVTHRFYLEDLAIGLFRPWFNVDSER
jgi:hypothetical protein